MTETRLDFDLLGRELLRALRGKRSQRAFSRWLGYRTNVAYAWESGRRAPTAAQTLRVAQRVRVDVRGALRRFFPNPPPWLEQIDPATREGVAALLSELRGGTRVSALARRSGLSRYAVSRCLEGETEPRLPAFLRLVEAASLRLLDLLAVLVPPEALPSLRAHWDAQMTRRTLAQEVPWSQAVVRALELASYRALPAHRPGWIAELLGISPEEEARCLDRLARAGLVHWDGTHYAEERVTALDTRLDPEAGRRMRLHWAAVARRQIERERPGQFSYNVFAVSRQDFERLRGMHLEYFRAMRALVAASGRSECVAVANVQLFELDERSVTSTSEGVDGAE